MADEGLVTEVTKFAFVMRLASLILVFFAPSAATLSLAGLAAIAFVVATSAFGLYRNSQVVRYVVAHPALVVLDVFAAALISYGVGAESPIVFYSMSTALLIGLLLQSRFAVLLTIILVASYYLAVQNSDTASNFTTWLALPTTYAAFGALGVLIRRLHAVAAADHATAQRLAVDAASARERARLARSMHDSVAKTLHGMSLAAAALPVWITRDTDVAIQRATELQHAATTAAKEARSVLLNLRQHESDRPLTELLRELVDTMAADSPAEASLSVSGIADCDDSIKEQLALIAAEALENVTRHSEASRALVECHADDRTIVLSIRDDGVGFDTTRRNPERFGLIGMAERVELIGGTLTIDSEAGHGTTITVRSPRVNQGVNQ